ncbi:MAG: DinB family protein [Acidobacteria bacterium]|nr:DinB family protein [Acidobacteriota bacterium]
MNELERFLAGWERVRSNVIQAAGDMPEAAYDFAPFAGIRTFHEQLQHILHNADVFVDCTVNGKFNLDLFDLYPYAGLSKDALLGALQSNLRRQRERLMTRSVDLTTAVIRYLDGSDRPAMDIMRGMKEHEIAHLNQMYFYLRAKGITPHSTLLRNAQEGH